MTQHCVIAVGLLSASLLLLAGNGEGRAACGGDASPFPLHIEAAKRYPTDRTGRPFFMQGDAAWSLIGDLRQEEADLYLEDRKARGFNAVLVNLLEHRFSRNAPANAYGEAPFTGPAFSTPNEAYFARADHVLQRACELGMLVLLAPAYPGYGGGEDGWYAQMAQAGVQKLAAYGRFVGSRYRRFDNIIWVHGGDFDPPDKRLVAAVANGVMEEDPDALGTAHNAPETAPLEFWGDKEDREPWLRLNNVYTYGPVYPAALREHERDGAMPFFLMESAYEFEHGADEFRIRIQAWHALLAGAFGHVFGNNPIWHFGGPGLHPQTMGWRDALDSPGAKSMQVLHDFITSIAWWKLVPDSGDTLLVNGNNATGAVAASASDGSFALVYMQGGDGATVDLTRLSTAAVAARWRDPTSGATLPVDGSPFAAKPQTFSPPGENAHGYADWILELFPDAPAEQSQ